MAPQPLNAGSQALTITPRSLSAAEGCPDQPRQGEGSRWHQRLLVRVLSNFLELLPENDSLSNVSDATSWVSRERESEDDAGELDSGQEVFEL